MPDLITISDVKAVRTSLTSASDATINAYITRASAAIIAHCNGRKFVVDDGDPATDRVFSITDEIVDIDDLSAAPTAAVILDTYGATYATLTVATDLVLIPRNREDGKPITSVRLRPSVTWAPGYELKLTGVWGFPEVPEDVKEATVATVIDWLNAGQGITPQTPDLFDPPGPVTRGLPRRAFDLLAPYRRISVG